MRTKKRPIIALLLAFALIFTLMPMPAYAANTVSVGTAQALHDALANAGNGDTVKLTADIEYSVSELGSITFGNKTVTLDFNGHGVDFSGTPFQTNYGTINIVNADMSVDYFVYYNYGTLNIKGTQGDGIYAYYVVYENGDEYNIGSCGTVNISDAAIEAEYIVEYNYGVSDMTNVLFEGDNVLYCNYYQSTMTSVTANVDDAVMSYNYGTAVFNDMNVTSYDYTFPVEDQYTDSVEYYGMPYLEINGGTYTGDYMNCCLYGDCVINNATFEAEDELEIYSSSDYPTHIVVNGGSFTVSYSNVFYVGSDAATLTITDGTFTTTSDYNVINVGYSADTVYLEGGTFIAPEGTPAFDNDFGYENIIVPKGYIAIPEDWQETGASQVTIVPTAYRYAGKNRYETAIKAADALKEELDIEKFGSVILACGSNYADALAGSYLASVKDAPILLVDKSQASIDLTQAYINANLNPGGIVYVLGGTGAVPDTAVEGLTGFEVKRLKGANRYDTNIAILEEAGVSGDEILVCSGTGFADSLSASATGLPILLVGASIMDSQKTYIQTLSGKDFYIIGGKGAVSLDIESYFNNLGDVTRIGGSNRYETSTNVAREFFDYPHRAVLAYGQNFPDGLSGGPLAYAMGGPLILAANGSSAKAAAYTHVAPIRAGVVLGGTSLISDSEVKTILWLPDSVAIVSK